MNISTTQSATPPSWTRVTIAPIVPHAASPPENRSDGKRRQQDPDDREAAEDDDALGGVEPDELAAVLDREEDDAGDPAEQVRQRGGTVGIETGAILWVLPAWGVSVGLAPRLLVSGLAGSLGRGVPAALLVTLRPPCP